MEIPLELRELFADSVVEDRSYSKTAKTYQLIRAGQKLFVKIAEQELLGRERRMSAFLHRHGLAPDVVGHGTCEDGAYLITTALEGRDGIATEHLAEPRRLAVAYGEALRRLHEIPVDGCPVLNRDDELRRLAETHLASHDYDASHIPEPLDEAAERFLQPIPDDPVVLHGDYCLPNVLFEDFRLTGFVDLGNGGVGGRHYDLYWGVWALEYNLKSNLYKDLFLDAYGRDLIVPELLDYNRIVSGLT